MSTSKNQSAIPNHLKLLLSNLTPLSSEDPSAKSQCHMVKLTDVQVEEFLSSSRRQIVFHTPSIGEIILSNSTPNSTPNSPSTRLRFTTHPTADSGDTARAFLFSRRASNQARCVGAISADMELDRRIDTERNTNASPRAMRTPEEGLKKVRQLQIGEFDQGGPPVKKQRTEPVSQQRPRISRSLAEVTGPKRERTERDEHVGNACSRVVSQGKFPKDVKTLKGSPAFCVLPMRIDPGKRSRHARPARNVDCGNGWPGRNSPSSPRVGNLSGGLDDMRKRVIHILGIGGGKFNAVRSRVIGDEARITMMEKFREALEEVGNEVSGVWVLDKSLWDEVEDGYEKYTIAERERMRKHREQVLNAKEDKLTEKQKVLDRNLREFEEQRKRLKDRSATLRKSPDGRLRYERWYPLYVEVISELECVSEKFKCLDMQMREARDEAEREIVSKTIQTAYSRYRKRREHLVEVLPKLHESLKTIRDALEVRRSES